MRGSVLRADLCARLTPESQLDSTTIVKRVLFNEDLLQLCLSALNFRDVSCAAATCMTGAWTTRKAVPAMSYWPLQGAGTYDTLMYAYIAGAKAPPSPANRGELYKYASPADTWATGSASPASRRCRSRW